MKRLIPTFNRILVQRVLQPAKTETGILLTEISTKLNSGKVIAVGPGSRDRDGQLLPVSVKEGDTVLLSEYGGTEVKLGEKVRGGSKPDGIQLSFGRYGIKSCESGRLSSRAIEAARRAIIGHFHRATSGQLRRNGKLWVKIFADLPVTSKPTEVRMGKGKGNVTGWDARVSTGQILFEMDGISLSNAQQAHVLASHKLCLPTKFVQWS